MNCYMVTFHCLLDVDYSPKSENREVVHSFYSDSVSDLTEQIIEFQEDLEDDDYIITSKDIKEVKCK